MRIVFFGTPEFAVPSLEGLIASEHTVVGVVTQPDRPRGRGQRVTDSPVKAAARAHGVPVLQPTRLRDPETMAALSGLSPDLGVVAAYGKLIPGEMLELPRYGMINVHASLLPKYRGAAPAAWTVINGEHEGGVTTMKLVEKMDAGAIYLQEALPLAADETSGTLQSKLTPIGARLLIKTLRGLKEGTLVPREQDESRATLAPMLKKEDGLIDWNRPAIEIERRVRGLNPWPGSYTYTNGKLLKVHRAKVLTGESSANPGVIIRADSGGFWIATSSGLIGLEDVQLENKKRLRGAEFIRGARIKAGDRLG